MNTYPGFRITSIACVVSLLTIIIFFTFKYNIKRKCEYLGYNQNKFLGLDNTYI